MWKSSYLILSILYLRTVLLSAVGVHAVDRHRARAGAVAHRDHEREGVARARSPPRAHRTAIYTARTVHGQTSHKNLKIGLERVRPPRPRAYIGYFAYTRAPSSPRPTGPP